MGIFDKSSGGPELGLPKLSRDRLEEVMTKRDWTYSIDRDGDLTGNWDYNTFYFFVTGNDKEILQVQSRWRQDLPLELRGEVLLAINEWHQTRLWPKGYIHVDDAGRMWVHAEHVVDWEHGVTTDQLTLTLNCAISTSLQLFEYLSERFAPSFSPQEP
ncbi:MAG: YbjN domain-containing protein [Bifidobacteriaceae bacterium]|jgi:hypothetical protein|nr:YbjN domain-containing protein [Bifidobacteriaceae bacterium]